MAQSPLLRTLIYTLIAMNVMITAILIGKEFVPVMASVPSMGSEQSKIQKNIDYSMEKIGSDRLRTDADGSGYWIVEHYREYEYHYDKRGKLIEKRPTNKEEHLRYWEPTHP